MPEAFVLRNDQAVNLQAGGRTSIEMSFIFLGRSRRGITIFADRLGSPLRCSSVTSLVNRPSRNRNRIPFQASSDDEKCTLRLAFFSNSADAVSNPSSLSYFH